MSSEPGKVLAQSGVYFKFKATKKNEANRTQNTEHRAQTTDDRTQNTEHRTQNTELANS